MPGTNLEEQSSTCGRLILSWILLIISVALMTEYGNAGWVMSLLPMGIVMKIRNAHDRAIVEKLREKGIWDKLALVYFTVILVVVGVLVARGVRVDTMPFPLLLLMMMCPAFVVMLFEDIKLCSSRRSDIS